MDILAKPIHSGFVLTPTIIAGGITGYTLAGGGKTLTVPLDASVSGTNTGDNAANTSVASKALDNLASVAMNASLQFNNISAYTFDIAPTANTEVGRALTISAGSTVTDGTADMAGGNLTLASGLGKGTGASSIIFQTGRTLTTGSTLQTLTTAMTILGSGNVGIGTANPLSKIQIQLDGIAVQANDGTENGLALVNSTAGTSGVIGQDSPALEFEGRYWDGSVSRKMTLRGFLRDNGVGTNATMSWFIRRGAGAESRILEIDASGQFSSPLKYNSWDNREVLNLGGQRGNDAAATATYDQYSPYNKYHSYGWKTGGTPASQSMSLGYMNAPEQGVTNPIGVHKAFYGTNTITPAEANELYRLEWGDRLGFVINKPNTAGFITSIFGNVGIGTTAPAFNLDVSGNAAVTQTYGATVITDGTFSVSGLPDWTLGTGWADGTGNAAKNTDGTGTLSQALTLSSSRWYKLTYNINSISGGSITPSLSSSSTSATARSTSGTFTEYLHSGATSNTLRFTPSVTGVRAVIDNVSLQLESANYLTWQQAGKTYTLRNDQGGFSGYAGVFVDGSKTGWLFSGLEGSTYHMSGGGTFNTYSAAEYARTGNYWTAVINDSSNIAKLWAEKIRVNTTSTDADLEINNTTGGKLRLTYNDFDGSAATYSDLQVNSSGNLLITSSGGNVGIGTTAPSDPLHIYSSGNTRLTIESSAVAGYAQFQLKNGTNAWKNQLNTGAFSFQDVSTNNSVFNLAMGSPTDSLKVTTTGVSMAGNLTVLGTGNSSITGNVGIGTTAPTISGTGKLDMNADTFRLRTARTPASASTAGNAGEICWDANYIYCCVATNTWVRTPILTWV